jgi:hypothetical protein
MAAEDPALAGLHLSASFAPSELVAGAGGALLVLAGAVALRARAAKRTR